MEEVKQILVVDDHFEMLEFLRSMLELSNHEYQVLGVPSAEEGLLELRRTPFDLLITDVRLPGMSGFELARKVKNLRADIPIIMITGYSSEQGKKEASEVGVMRYFKKPLDTDALLAAVHTTLYGAEVVSVESVAEAVEMELPADVRKRLETLRSDTGARQVMLSTLEGEILYEGGSGGSFAISRLAGNIAESMRSSFLLAEQLGSPEPFSIQYQAGQRYDLYSANVGLNYFVAIFFDAQARRGRLGTIWVFAQRAINDLQTMLADHRPIKPGVTPPANDPTSVQAQVVATEIETPAAAAPAAEAKAAVVETPAPVLEPEPEMETVEELEEEIENTPVEEMEPLTLADIHGLLGIEAPVESLDIDLDSFWDDALGEEMSELNASGMTLKEAREQGLIPTEFDQPGQAGEGN